MSTTLCLGLFHPGVKLAALALLEHHPGGAVIGQRVSAGMVPGPADGRVPGQETQEGCSRKGMLHTDLRRREEVARREHSRLGTDVERTLLVLGLEGQLL